MTDPAPDDDGFVDFFRRYAKTWVHAVAVAGLTAFGTLTVVHTWFAGVALAVYVVPPVALYLSRTIASRRAAGTDTEPDVGDDAEADAGADARSSRWTTADAPVDATLHDAVVTPAAAYAVGDGGVVLSGGDEGWSAALEDGPGADSRTLRGVDATAGGNAVWTAGDGGALARIDADTGRHVDRSAPRDVTNAWVDVAVVGEAGAEIVLLVDGSGQVLRGRYRDGEVAWTPPQKPGGGSSLTGVDVADDSAGYLCDSNDGAFETADAGETFRRVGDVGADGTLSDVAALRRDGCLVCDDDGVVHRYDGSRWTPRSVEDGALLAVAGNEEYAVACGEGAVHELVDGSPDWDRTVVPTTGTLRGVDAGVRRAVAVGDDGTVVERRLRSP